MESFAAGAAALAFAAAAFAAAKAAASPVWRGRRFGVSASSDDVESAFPPRADGSIRETRIRRTMARFRDDGAGSGWTPTR